MVEPDEDPNAHISTRSRERNKRPYGSVLREPRVEMARLTEQESRDAADDRADLPGTPIEWRE